MELKEFIVQSLKDITDGLSDGDKHIKNSYSNTNSGIMESPHKIDFDIAVTSNEEKSSGIGGKITVAQIFAAGGKEESKDSQTNFSRIKFSVHVKLNYGHKNG